MIFIAVLSRSDHVPTTGSHPLPENISLYASSTFAYFGKITTNLPTTPQLSGEFDKKRLDELRCTTEHPRIKVEYGDFFLLKLIPGEVNKRRFSRTPRAKDADYNPLLGIKGKYMLNEILSVRNSTNSILFGIFYRVVTNYHHVSPMQIRTL